MAHAFSQATSSWFEGTFDAATPVQARGWPAIQSGDHALMLAPTGSGKTLAAFLACIDRLTRLDPDAPDGVRILYISPLKALAYDIERNLRAPLVGIGNAAAQQGLGIRNIRVDIRTGDTSQKERRAQSRRPADILVTTPESLYLILGSQARETLKTVQSVIIDEIHVMAGTKRGVHLALTLERLAALCPTEPQRIGLSATQRPLDRVARYLGGTDRPVTVIDASSTPRMNLEIVVPIADMENPVIDDPRQANGGIDALGEPLPRKRVQHGIWPAIHPKLLALIRAHRSTILFVNSRLLCERLAQRLNELAGEELVRAHHGSISHSQRTEIEEMLKRGTLPALVATSSLELGIDMGAVDLVILVESPGSVARGLQRIGRAGHSVGAVSEGRVFPKFRGDLLECAVVARHMQKGEIEETRVPANCLDVLAQHIVAMVGVADLNVDDLLALVQRAAPYATLTPELLGSVLDMLSGRYPSDAFADLSPRLNWDRNTDLLTARRGAKMLAALNAGTIPDRGMYGVFLVGDGPRIGELDEEMVYESRRGDTIILGATSWRIEEITRDRVNVTPAPGEPGRLPFWRGERPGRPLALGRAIGAFTRALASKTGPEAAAWLTENTPLDPLAAQNLAAYVQEQKEAVGALPTDRAITVERFRDELGDWRVCILTPFGARVHAPWALAIEARLSEIYGFDVQTFYSDDGISLRFADVEELPDSELLFPDPEDIEERLITQLRQSALFQTRFRENAARALLLPRKRPTKRTPLWMQRRKAATLLAVAGTFPSFPIVLETYRECLQDVFDVPALVEILQAIRGRAIHVDEVETTRASPFSRGLAFQFVAAYLYDGDSPLAERKAQALALDRALLRELLGQEELRDLLDADAVSEVEARLQYLLPERLCRHEDAVHDLLRRLGDLTDAEIAARSMADPTEWIAQLSTARRIVAVRIAGEPRWIAAEDAGRYREALGVALPPGIPRPFLEPGPEPLIALLTRWARTHGPFLTRDIATRFGLATGMAEALLGALRDKGALLYGELRPGGLSREWCDPEVLRQLRRASLAALRKEVEPVEPEVFSTFLAGWHGLGTKRTGIQRLMEVVDQLIGAPLPFSALENEILPARIQGFRPQLLDELGAMGGVVWLGRGALGQKDGRIALYRRDLVGLLLEEPPDLETALATPTPLHRALMAHLQQRGASFLVELQVASGGAPLPEVLRALWDLVWAGLVTNDTFQPLRSLRARTTNRRLRVAGGRWSSVSFLIGTAPRPEEQALARANTWLERYGVVSREVPLTESSPGGFKAIYPVLRTMEESGKVRRGYFVEGLGGAQFSMPGAVDRLRSCRDRDPEALVLSAVDPANLWGALLPWPATGSETVRPKRVSGARVILVGGRPLLYVAKGAKRVITFTPFITDPTLRLLALEALKTLKTRQFRITALDGEAPDSSPLTPLFEEAGFTQDYKGLVLD